MRQKIAFRVDASHQIGFGHLNRCLVLAKELKKKANILFIMKHNEQANKMVNHEKFKIIILEGNLTQIIKKEKINKIIIDLKQGTSKKFVSDIQKTGAKVILLDDVGEGRKNADVVIYPVAHLDKKYLKDIKGKLYHGWDYVIVDKKFFGKRNPRNENQKPKVLVSMGGSDVRNMTPKIIDALKKIKEKFECTVIIGPGFKNKNIKVRDKRFKIKRNVTNLANLMLQSDVGIILFGTSIYEATAARLPCILISSLRNKQYAERFSKFQTCIYLNDYNGLNQKKLIKSVITLLNDQNLIKKLEYTSRKFLKRKRLIYNVIQDEKRI
ncbi:MAG: hypothetical protein KKF46_01810 [Nanoarchaeota archaeon]|nr:hypothetical protein [Nanoarchaeota archaeon]MBU1321068.1 hypothetical protein [Nanoarchaeota archaeon]MBU1597073.1 hypothetical protein [Nanoarchaeota archaeon]MBU2440863.1 hypothetical protein [Nanoarchaeota archaeon]